MCSDAPSIFFRDSRGKGTGADNLIILSTALSGAVKIGTLTADLSKNWIEKNHPI